MTRHDLQILNLIFVAGVSTAVDEKQENNRYQT